LPLNAEHYISIIVLDAKHQNQVFIKTRDVE